MLKRALFDNLKNLRGWRSNRKLLVLSVDDYACVRLKSPEALTALQRAGVKPVNRFDRFDAFETTTDLEALFGVLGRHVDSKGRHPVISAYAVAANPDFDKTLDERRYVPEPVSTTIQRLENDDPEHYEGLAEKWEEGMGRGFLNPQFHGREHFNVDALNALLATGNPDLLVNLQHRSMSGVRVPSELAAASVYVAFPAGKENRLTEQAGIIAEGFELFSQVFGQSPTCFAPPSLQLDPSLYSACSQLGLGGIDLPFLQDRDQSPAWPKVNVLGQQRDDEHVTIVRNVVFEPGHDAARDWVGEAIKQIAVAFRWGKPANISSHRVNFAGRIDEQNRAGGVNALDDLLARVLRRWPDVEFIGSDALVDVVMADRQ